MSTFASAAVSTSPPNSPMTRTIVSPMTISILADSILAECAGGGGEPDGGELGDGHVYAAVTITTGTNGGVVSAPPGAPLSPVTWPAFLRCDAGIPAVAARKQQRERKPRMPSKTWYRFLLLLTLLLALTSGHPAAAQAQEGEKRAILRLKALLTEVEKAPLATLPALVRRVIDAAEGTEDAVAAAVLAAREVKGPKASLFKARILMEPELLEYTRRLGKINPKLQTMKKPEDVVLTPDESEQLNNLRDEFITMATGIPKESLDSIGSAKIKTAIFLGIFKASSPDEKDLGLIQKFR